MTSVSIKQANAAYENWLRDQLPGEVVEADLEIKHKKMAKGAFPFLRATYWRWAETILDLCPDLKTTPSVLAVGDIHLENYGSWRDADGRLVWGVNDFDEAADMPYAVDLVRLAVSAILARKHRDLAPEEICAAILEGYRKGLQHPRAFVLDEKHTWLFKRLRVRPNKREEFWAEMDALKPGKTPPAACYRTAIEKAMPGQKLAITFAPRLAAGVGSLGRPRWVGIADWHDGRVVREAKALVPSAWTLVFPPKSLKQQSGTIAAGRYRAPDPWYAVYNNVVVRRLSPNSRKVEMKKGKSGRLLDVQLLHAMGHELANVQHGVQNKRAAVAADLAKRPRDWLLANANTAADFVRTDYKNWKKP